MLKLETELSKIQGIGQKFLSRLVKLNIKTVKDLLWHFPFRYEDFSRVVKISDLQLGQSATVRATVKKISMRRTWRRKLLIIEAILIDETGGIKAIWFNQPYITHILRDGVQANFAGKVVASDDEIYLSNPGYELLRGTTEAKHTAGLIPIYPETKSLTSKGIRFLIKPILSYLEPVDDFIPEAILEKNDLPDVNQALKKIHFPMNLAQAERAKKRFAFEDLFLLQLNNIKTRLQLAKEKAPPLKISQEELDEIIKKLPFELTPSQLRSLKEIVEDLGQPQPMNRLLQGDVGSGKTVVVAIAALIAAMNNKQTAFMAPTEVLARQHYKTLTKIFGKMTTGIGLLTSSEARSFYGDDLETKRSRKEILKELENGKIKIIIGTHALIVKGVLFKDLALTIVDEQHRFGVQQRAALVTRGPTQNKRGLTRTETPTDAEGLLYEDLTYQIRGMAFNIKKKLGLGHKESVYQNAFEEELKNAAIVFEKEKVIGVKYGIKKIGAYRPDFIIENKIILELKAEPYTGRVHEKQLWSYLRGSEYKLALLINFAGEDVEIKRIIYDMARSLRESASSPRQSAIPHFLSMSATPIPRTLSLTLFGDLDISIIDELPKGRKPILTKVVDPQNRKKAYEFIRQHIKNGRQAFVICPRIEPRTADQRGYNIGVNQRTNPHKSALLWETKAVKEEYEKLSKQIFPDLRVAMLHGRMKSSEKEKIMSEFAAGGIDILVSTSVIEVGVDVPNSTIMVIEGADRFGLAQLYQFRGRVGRGEHQSFCFLFSDSSSQQTHQRLHALLKAKNGFELAEKDLAIRGPGQFLGEKQTGLPDLAMNSLNNIELIRMARSSAEEIIKKSPELKNYPLLKGKLESFRKQIHLE